MKKETPTTNAVDPKEGSGIIVKNGIDVLDSIFNQWSDRLVPVNVVRNNDGSKKVSPKAWKNNQQYSGFDNDFNGCNTVALRAGGELGVIDVDTKDLSQLDDVWRPLIQNYLDNPSTLIVESENGYHIYIDTGDFKLRSTAKTGANKSSIPFIDFRGEGGLIFVASIADKVSYKVISDLPVTAADNSLITLLPEYNEKKIDTSVEGFTNLDDETDKIVLEVNGNNVYPAKEVKKMLHTLDDWQDRDWLLSIVGSAYALLSEENKKKTYTKKTGEEGNSFRRMINGWVKAKWKDNLGDKEKNVVRKVLDEVISGNYGQDLNGGTLIREAQENGYVLPKEGDTPVDESLKGVKMSFELAKKFFEVEMVDKEIDPLETDDTKTPLIFKGYLHSLYGLSGTYKSTTAIRLVSSVIAKNNMSAFFLDGELNGGIVKELCIGAGINYLPADIAEGKIDKFIKHEIDCSETIFILDSFSRMLKEGMSNYNDTDTTKTMEKAQALTTKLGATVIVIEHGTAQEYDKTTGTAKAISAKMQGNEEGKKRLCDMVYKSVPNGNHYDHGVTLHVMKTRAYEVLPLGEKIDVALTDQVDAFENIDAPMEKL